MDKNTKLLVNGKRLDGRGIDDLRPLKIQAGVLHNAEGSAYLEWGNNKVLAAVYGPREVVPRHDTNPYKAVVRCRYNMSPFCSLEEHGRTGPNRRANEISKVLRQVFENIVLTEYFPKTAIDIFIEILQAEGGTRVAGLTAATVALANAGIPMRDMVAGISVGKIDGTMVTDIGKSEDNLGESDMPLAISARTGEYLLFQMDGLLTKKEISEGLDKAERAITKINALQVSALRQIYEAKQGGMV